MIHIELVGERDNGIEVLAKAVGIDYAANNGLEEQVMFSSSGFLLEHQGPLQSPGPSRRYKIRIVDKSFRKGLYNKTQFQELAVSFMRGSRNQQDLDACYNFFLDLEGDWTRTILQENDISIPDHMPRATVGRDEITHVLLLEDDQKDVVYRAYTDREIPVVRKLFWPFASFPSYHTAVKHPFEFPDNLQYGYQRFLDQLQEAVPTVINKALNLSTQT